MAVDLLVAVVVGLGLGIFFQKGRFCFVHAFRDLFALKDSRVTKGVIAATLLTMLGWSLLYHYSSYQGFWTPGWGLTGLIGGIIFGVGMTYAGGCASGTLYRAGQGYLHFWITLAFMGAGYVVFTVLFPAIESLYFEPLTLGSGATLFERQSLSAPVVALSVSGLVMLTYVFVLGLEHASRTRLPAGTDTGRIQLSVVLTAVTGAKRFVTGTRRYLAGFLEIDDWIEASRRPWDPRTAALGITALAMVWFAHVSIVGITGPEARWTGWLLAQVGVDTAGYAYWGSILFADAGVRITADMVMVATIIVGAGLAAAWSGDFSLRVPKRRRIPNAVIGGFLMGIGSRLAPGCNIGNIYSGIAILSMHSFVAAFGIILGVYIMTHWLYRDVGCAI